MEKFFTLKFAVLLFLSLLLFIVHEFGHYLAYRALDFPAVVRKSILVPGIDPKETIVVTKVQGIFIALNGFVLSTVTIVLAGYFLGYQLWNVLLIGSIAGSSVDFLWALSMIFQKRIMISSR